MSDLELLVDVLIALVQGSSKIIPFWKDQVVSVFKISQLLYYFKIYYIVIVLIK